MSQDPDSADSISSVLTQMQQSVEAGDDVSVPGVSGAPDQQLSEIADALDAARNDSGQGAAASTTNATKADFTFDVAVPRSEFGLASYTSRAAGTPDPYALRGYTINSSATWQVATEIDASLCGMSGCDIIDKARQTWKITPGLYGDKFSFNAIYTNNHGNLTHLYADLSVVCGRTVCGTGYAGKSGPQDGSGSGNPVISHDSQRGGTTVDRVRMHALLVPNNTTYYDSVQTGTARCDNSSCKF